MCRYVQLCRGGKQRGLSASRLLLAEQSSLGSGLGWLAQHCQLAARPGSCISSEVNRIYVGRATAPVKWPESLRIHPSTPKDYLGSLKPPKPTKSQLSCFGFQGPRLSIPTHSPPCPGNSMLVQTPCSANEVYNTSVLPPYSVFKPL